MSKLEKELDKKIEEFVEELLNDKNVDRKELNKAVDKKLDELMAELSNKLSKLFDRKPTRLCDDDNYDSIKNRINELAFNEDNHCIMLTTDHGTLASGTLDMLLTCLSSNVSQLRKNNVPRQLIEEAVRIGFENNIED